MNMAHFRHQRMRAVHRYGVILENVRSARNVGHVIKSGAVHGAGMVGLVGITPVVGRKVMRGSLGAEECVTVFKSMTTEGAVERMRCTWRDVLVVGVETSSRSVACSDLMSDATFMDKAAARGVVLVLGSEVDGVDASTLALCDHHVHLPLYGNKHSLNVADCASVVTSYMQQALPPHATLPHPAGSSFPGILEYPPEASVRPPNRVADKFTKWANKQLGTFQHPIPYG
eukprot:TRINITY_DN8603_c0_g1_i1.p1 TRINITY_DN8603_c0_g1~~TRINITY_DN8603_c0_g1_i1.p1  ORF type:complete len:229 (+),score=60.47 TRINITY_DN8603_c0_g1_i1:357-1043(+)